VVARRYPAYGHSTISPAGAQDHGGPAPEIWWDRPGQSGINTTDRCGKPRIRDGQTIGRRCPVHLVAHMAREVCKRADCGNWDCVEAWARRAARSAEHQFQAMMPALRECGYRVGSGARHWIASPPQASASKAIETLDGFDKLRRELGKILACCGLHGGAVVFHPHRHEGCRFRGGPHFHIVAFGYALHVEAMRARHPGWVFKNKGPRKTIAGTLQYMLDHCGVARRFDGSAVRKNRLTWYGTMSPTKRRKVGEITVEVKITCRELTSKQATLDGYQEPCGAVMERIEIESGHIFGPAVEMVKIGQYEPILELLYCQQRLKAD